MTSATELAELGLARILLVGYPGAGKTGSLACLLNAGFKMRVLAYDKMANMAPLIMNTKPEFLPNLDIISCEDNLRYGQKFAEPDGLPEAFVKGHGALVKWVSVNPKTGEKTDLGASKKWGADTVVVLDSLTSMGRAAMRKAQPLMNRTPLNTRDSDYGFAMVEQEAFVERLTASDNGFHVIVLAHLKIVGPKDVRKGEEDVTRILKEREVDLVSTRLYPSALGKVLPPVIAGHFSTTLLMESSFDNRGRAKRMIRTLPRPELDLKVPAPDLPSELDISDGLLKVFEALTGGVDRCLSPTEEGDTTNV